MIFIFPFFLILQGRKITTQYEPEIISEKLHRKELCERYREHREEQQREYINENRHNSDEWISSSNRGRGGYQANENYGSVMDSNGKRSNMRLVKVQISNEIRINFVNFLNIIELIILKVITMICKIDNTFR